MAVQTGLLAVLAIASALGLGAVAAPAMVGMDPSGSPSGMSGGMMGDHSGMTSGDDSMHDMMDSPGHMGGMMHDHGGFGEHDGSAETGHETMEDCEESHRMHCCESGEDPDA